MLATLSINHVLNEIEQPRALTNSVKVLAHFYFFISKSLPMRPFLGKLIGSFGYIIQYGCIAHCTFEYVGDFVVCTGPSMEPTIYSDDILLTERLTARFRKLNRGDVIIAKCPSNPKQFICKRVTGLPGDKMRTGFASSEVVPRGHVWLEGDNRCNSADSRSYGSVPQGLIRSRALLKVWPLDDFSSFIR